MRAASGGGDPNRAEAALAPPLGNPRFPLVDSMRAIAVIAIFLFHALDSKWTARLNVGVPLFFVISAFLLYRPFVAARYQDKPRIRTRDFLQRRVLRIVPAYWVAVLVILASIGAPAYAIDGYDKLGMYLLLVQNYRPETVLLLIPGAWSLCVEASFYLALPAYAAAAASWASGPRGFRRELWLLVAIAILSVTYRDILFATSGDTVFAWATLPATALWFALGMGAAVISVASEVDRRRSWVKRHILH